MARRHRSPLVMQLSLFAAPPAAATTASSSSTTATAATAATTTAGAPMASRTRLLQAAIARELPGARVVITDNKTVLLSQQQRRGDPRVVRVHQLFLDGDDEVRAAVARFLARGDRASGAIVDAFVDRQHHLLNGAARPLPDGAHLGRVHDLGALFVALNDRYFERRIVGEIGWGALRRHPRRQRSSITFGSWDHRQRRIVVHPALDQPHVPTLAVSRVVHHEMLHAWHGEERDARGRRVVHGPAFRADEARFHGAAEADAWFDAHLDELLRFRPRTPP